MGIFGKRESYSAQDVRQMMQPIIDLFKEIEKKANSIDQMSKDWISDTGEIVALIYCFDAKCAAESQRLIQLLLKGTVSSAAHSAAMKSLNFLSDQRDERMAFITQSLIDSGMPYKLGIEFHKNSWTQAFEISPKDMADFERLLSGATKWDWINKTSWT